MRAIIIEEERFTELLALFKAREAELLMSNTPVILGCTTQIWKAAIDEARRELHYVFVRWAQSHGASCIK